MTNPKITKTHFGVYGIIKQKNKLLLIKKMRGPYTGLFDLPGGGPEDGETHEQTLIREIKEETGCDVISMQNKQFKSIVFSDFTKQSGETGVLQHNAVLYDTTIKGEPSVTGDERDSGGCVWVDVADLTQQNATPYALMAANKPLIALADENDHVIATQIRGTPLPPNRFIMISAVLLFDSQENLIMQKIAAHKKWGGMWTYSAAGHVDAGENYEQAAIRELKEEMEVDAVMEQEIAAVPCHYDGRLVARHHVFIAHSDAPITPDPYEAADTKKISPKELKKQIKENPQDFLEPFVKAFYTYCDSKNI